MGILQKTLILSYLSPFYSSMLTPTPRQIALLLGQLEPTPLRATGQGEIRIRACLRARGSVLISMCFSSRPLRILCVLCD
jgi:hypothetical protein